MSGPPATSTSALLSTGYTIQAVSDAIALPLGTVGNIITIFIMMRPSMRNSSASIYCSAIAIFDFLCLYAAIPSNYAGYNRFGNGNSYNEVTCVLSMIMLRGGGSTVIWLLVALGVDRMIAVRFPLKAKTILNVRRACAVTAGVVFVCFGLNMTTIFTRGIQILPGPNGTSTSINCGYTSEAAAYFELRINSWIAISMSLLPIAVAMVLNATIIQGLIKSQSFRKSSSSASDSRDASSSRVRSVATMLASASVLSISLTAPNTIALAVMPFVLSSSDPSSIETFLFIRIITVSMNIQSHANNFIVYCVSGSRFREELRAAFSWCCKRGDATSSTSSSGQTRKTASSGQSGGQTRKTASSGQSGGQAAIAMSSQPVNSGAIQGIANHSFKCDGDLRD